MRHILTCDNTINIETVQFLHEQWEKRRKERTPPVQGPRDLSGPNGPPQVWLCPNLIVFGHSDKPPIPGQRKCSSSGPPEEEPEEEDTEKPADGSDQRAGKKQNIRGFSAKSSLSISRLLSTLDWQKNGQCMHITLTYRNQYPQTKQALQLEKQALVKGLTRCGVECGIWKLEYQTRETAQEKLERLKAGLPRTKGAGSLLVPHWHILAWIGRRNETQFADTLIEWWQHHSGNTHQRAVDMRPGDAGKASFYLSLHAAKHNQSPNLQVGRWWGYIQRAKLMESQRVNSIGYIARLEAIWWRRLYCRYRHIKCPIMLAKGYGFSWFLPESEQIKAACWVRDYSEFQLATLNNKDKPF